MTCSKNILSDVFGFQKFRHGQEEIIDYLIGGKNLLAVMPTGAGKSICYQIPALLFKNQTIIISPLVALMNDQVLSLKDLGINADRTHSQMSEFDRVKVWKNFISKKLKILYVSPEFLMQKTVILSLIKLKISMFVIDEAHCISKWGSDFRKEYEQLKELKNLFPKSIISAFTATADYETRIDINKKLTGGKGKIFLHGFSRPNLTLAVEQKYDWKKQLIHFLKNKNNQSGIVYCLSRKQTENCSSFLSKNGFNALPFHAGLESKIKRITQDRFMTEENLIICATIAFGMGIDKSNVRFVVHINLPGSMEAFYQEIGRAGRDGKESDTLLIFGYDDLFQRRRFIDQSDADNGFKIKEHKRLDSLMAYCDSFGCRKQTLLSYFDENSELCGKCDNCLDPPILIEGTEYAQMVLSAIYRTGQYFGTNHIIDVLKGVNNEKIKRKGHDKIKTFGVGVKKTKEFWKNFIRQLVSSNFIKISIQKFGGLEITKTGEKVLKGEDEYFYRKILDHISLKNKVKSRANTNFEISSSKKEFLLSLKSLRLKLAKKKKIPAYIIFPDRTLNEMVVKKPKNFKEFSLLNGVGPKKVQKYGNAFLEVIKIFTN